MEEEVEIWKEVIGYDGWYEISSLGRVRSYRTRRYVGRTEKPFILNIQGLRGTKSAKYPFVKLVKDSFDKGKVWKIHRLIAIHFIDNPNNYNVVNHLDGDPWNSAISNLEWTTDSGNQKHAYDTGLRKKLSGEKSYRHKITNEQAITIAYSSESAAVLSERYGVQTGCIHKIKQGRSWSEITGKPHVK